eukprot:941331-Prymnesium_polylepis.2
MCGAARARGRASPLQELERIVHQDAEITELQALSARERLAELQARESPSCRPVLRALLRERLHRRLRSARLPHRWRARTEAAADDPNGRDVRRRATRRCVTSSTRRAPPRSAACPHGHSSWTRPASRLWRRGWRRSRRRPTPSASARRRARRATCGRWRGTRLAFETCGTSGVRPPLALASRPRDVCRWSVAG